jgi:hypothetical protein
MRVENHGGMISTGESSDSSIRALAIIPLESSGNIAGVTGEGDGGFVLSNYFCSCFRGPFNMP